MCGEGWLCPCGIYHIVSRHLCDRCKGIGAPIGDLAEAHGDVPRITDAVAFNALLSTHACQGRPQASSGVALRNDAAAGVSNPSGHAGCLRLVRA